MLFLQKKLQKGAENSVEKSRENRDETDELREPDTRVKGSNKGMNYTMNQLYTPKVSSHKKETKSPFDLAMEKQAEKNMAKKKKPAVKKLPLQEVSVQSSSVAATVSPVAPQDVSGHTAIDESTNVRVSSQKVPEISTISIHQEETKETSQNERKKLRASKGASSHEERDAKGIEIIDLEQVIDHNVAIESNKEVNGEKVRPSRQGVPTQSTMALESSISGNSRRTSRAASPTNASFPETSGGRAPKKGPASITSGSSRKTSSRPLGTVIESSKVIS